MVAALRAACLAWLLLVHAGAADTQQDEPSCPNEGGPGCSTLGSAMLQVRSDLQRLSVDSALLGGLVKNEKTGAMEGTIAGARLVMHPGSEALLGNADRFIIEMDDDTNTCTNEDIDRLSGHFLAAEGAVVDFKGQPSAGGFCMIILTATLDQVFHALTQEEGAIVTHSTVVETDVTLLQAVGDRGDIVPVSATATARGPGPRPASDLPNWDRYWPGASPAGLDRIDQAQETLDHLPYDPKFTGDGVNVFVVGEGVWEGHPEFLGGKAVRAADFSTGKLIDCAKQTLKPCADDLSGHGTFIAGIIAGDIYGVAKKAKIYAVKAWQDNGKADMSKFMMAFEYAILKKVVGPKVISFNSYFEKESFTKIVNRATNKHKIVVVTAAGDYSSEARCPATQAKQYTLRVGAIIPLTTKKTRSTNDGWCVLFAPGKFILSAWKREDQVAFWRKPGTKVASAFAAGAAAMILEKNPNFGPKKVMQMLANWSVPSVEGKHLLHVPRAAAPSTTSSSTTSTTLEAPAPPPPPSSPLQCGVVDASLLQKRAQAQAAAGHKIIGGTEADPFSMPWTVALVTKWSRSPFCGGTLVSEKVVVTAAHCLDGSGSFDVVVAEHDWTDTSHGVRHTVREFVNHPQYNSITLENDIGIIKLWEPAHLGPGGAVPACLPDAADAIPNGARATVAGWGLLHEGSSRPPDVLHYVEVPMMENAACQSLLSGVSIHDDMICAGNPIDGGIDSCQGDSGGPLTRTRNGKTELIGVVSFGIGCARPGYPGVYSRVTANLQWIHSHSLS